MDKPVISYVILTKNEGKQLKPVFKLLSKYMANNECIILDDFSDDLETQKILEELRQKKSFSIYQSKLAGDYSAHRNSVFEFCKGEYIVSIDGDEIPSEFLLRNLPEVLKANPEIELYWVPRINNFTGVTPEYAKQWGWDINNPNKWINWNNGDYQTRIFKNLPHIRWKGRLHERINGNRTYVFLPKEEDYAFVHNKSIEQQLETNLRYNKDFSVQDNKGIHE